jgi:hypothetical protein
VASRARSIKLAMSGAGAGSSVSRFERVGDSGRRLASESLRSAALTVDPPLNSCPARVLFVSSFGKPESNEELPDLLSSQARASGIVAAPTASAVGQARAQANVKARAEIIEAVERACAAGGSGDFVANPPLQIGRESFDLAPASALASTDALFPKGPRHQRFAHVPREKLTSTMQRLINEPFQNADGRNLAAR